MAYVVTVSVDQSGAGTTTILAAVPYFKIEVMAYTLVLDANGTLAWSDGTDWLSGDMEIAEKGGVAVASASSHFPLMSGGTGRPMQITTVGAGAQGHVTLRVT